MATTIPIPETLVNGERIYGPITPPSPVHNYSIIGQSSEWLTKPGILVSVRIEYSRDAGQTWLLSCASETVSGVLTPPNPATGRLACAFFLECEEGLPSQVRVRAKVTTGAALLIGGSLSIE